MKVHVPRRDLQDNWYKKYPQTQSHLYISKLTAGELDMIMRITVHDVRHENIISGSRIFTMVTIFLLCIPSFYE
jgi:hypothetical protein